jgi:hypothetical protein
MFKRIILFLCLAIGPVEYLYAGSSRTCTNGSCDYLVIKVDKTSSGYNYTERRLATQSSQHACARYLTLGMAPVTSTGVAYYGSEYNDSSECSSNYYSSNDSRVLFKRMDQLNSTERTICNEYYNASDLVENNAIITSFSTSSKGSCTISRQTIRQIAGGRWSCYPEVSAGYYINRIEDGGTTCSANKYLVQEIRESNTKILSCGRLTNLEGWSEGSSKASSTCKGSFQYEYHRIPDADPGYACSVPSGYVATRAVSDSSVGHDCGGNSTAYKIELPKDGLSYCAGIGGTSTTDIPPNGMIVSAISLSTDCDKDPLDKLEKVTVSTPRVNGIMCTKYGTLPTGFGLHDQKNRSVCGATSGLNSGGVLVAQKEGAAYCDLPTNLTGDWVITDISSPAFCDGGYAYTIDQASRTSESGICWVYDNDTSIPDDFVITNDKDSSSGVRCDGSLAYAYKIALPSKTTSICNLLHLPSNYAVTETGGSTSACNNSSYGITLIQGDGPFNICANTISNGNFPSGFVVTSVFASSDCGDLLKTAYRIEAPKSTGTTHVCNVQSQNKFPPRLVATAISKSNDCSVNKEAREGYDAHYPPEDIKSVMCNGSILPSGFEYYNFSTASNCNTFTAAKYIQMIGLEMAYITPFVSPEVSVDPASVTPPTYDCSDAIANSGVINGISKNNTTCP